MKRFLATPLRKMQYCLLCGDAVIISAVLLMARFAGIFYRGGNLLSFWGRISWFFPVTVLVYHFSFYIFELYSVPKLKKRIQTLVMIAISVTFAAGLTAIISYLFPQQKPGRVFLIEIPVPLLVLFIYLWRRIFFNFMANGANVKNLVFFDPDPSGAKIKELLAKHPLAGYHMTSIFTSYDHEGRGPETAQCVSGRGLAAIVRKVNIRTIVVSESFRRSREFKGLLLDLKFKGVEILDFPAFYSAITGKISISHSSQEWLLFSQQNRVLRPAIYKKVKRLLDVLIALSGLLLFSPLFALIAVAVKATSKGPVFFRQERLGMDEKPFTVLKFRTMIDNAEQFTGPKWSGRGDNRITAAGDFLRKTRLDEIPQLVNILRGEMSFVGPRPIRRHFADMLGGKFPFYRMRFGVMPGMTGWAQVNGNYAGSEEGQLEKLEYELFYIHNQSLFLDSFVLLKTIQTVLFRRGE